MYSHRSFLISAAAICAVLIGACGSSSPSSDQTGGGQGTTVTVTHTVTEPATVSQTITTQTAPGTTTTSTTTTATSTTSSTTGGSSVPTTTTGGSTECVAADLKPSFLGTNGSRRHDCGRFCAHQHQRLELHHLRLAWRAAAFEHCGSAAH